MPGYPHHITQRGIRGLTTFFDDAGYRLYLRHFRVQLSESGLTVCAYCLMPNHIHVIAIPGEEDSLARHFRAVHSTYAKEINAKYGWKGHLWQERFYSVVMDELHFLAALRYVELNPVRAGLCKSPEQWPWSSVHSNLGRRDDGIVDTELTSGIVSNWRDYLAQASDRQLQDALRTHTRTGRPAGSDEFIDELEIVMGASIRPEKAGRKRKKQGHCPPLG